MQVKLLIVRHGITAENSRGIYIGSRTDVSLCEDGIAKVRDSAELIKSKTAGNSFRLVVSPMKRCIETANIIFPNCEMNLQDGFKEADFGRFEGKNYDQLSGDEEYQKWIDSNGKLPFPGGESVEEFIQRSFDAFKKELLLCDDGDALIIVAHGGTIMAVMSCLSGEDYYSFKVSNADGYVASLNVEDNKIGLVSYERIKE